MNSDTLLEYIVNNIICFNKSKSKELFIELIIDNPELYEFINKAVEDKIKEIEAIDKNNPEYISARDEALNNIPISDYSAYSYASRKFDLDWINNNKSCVLKR